MHSGSSSTFQKIQKENATVVRNNGNKSVLFLRSAKGGEENIGQKTHLFVQKRFDKARKYKDYFFITILLVRCLTTFCWAFADRTEAFDDFGVQHPIYPQHLQNSLS